MEIKTVEKLCVQYLDRYAAKDLEAVASMFDEKILLRDWKISVKGKSIAVEETQKNFESATSIEITTLAMHCTEQTAIAELKIIVDHAEELYVVDIISFNQQEKISSIHAYLGRAD